MKVKRTLHEIYSKLTGLRKQRDEYGNLIVMSMLDGNQKMVEYFTEKYKHFDEIIVYLSQIEVEYEDKYETEDESL